jgi:hypothetical protein
MHLSLSFAVIALALCAAAPVLAGEVACLTSINGEKRPLVYDPDEPNVKANITWRERNFGGPEGIECPGFVTLNAILKDMDPQITYAEQAPFCLQFDEARQTYTGVAVGERTARVICRKPSRTLCQRVNATRDTVLAVAGYGASVATGSNATATAAGISAVAEASGVTVLSGTAGALGSAATSLGSGAVAALSAPAALAATAVTVVVAGGALYACSE